MNNDTLASKRIAALINAAAKAATDTILAKLVSMQDQEKVTLSDLHRLIGKIRVVPATQKVPVLADDGTPVLDAKGNPTFTEVEIPGETKEVVEHWDLAKISFNAIEEVNPGAFKTIEKGRLAGNYRGSVPVPESAVKPDSTPEEKAAFRLAKKAIKEAQTAANAMQAAFAVLKAAGIAVPDSMLTPTK